VAGKEPMCGTWVNDQLVENEMPSSRGYGNMSSESRLPPNLLQMKQASSSSSSLKRYAQERNKPRNYFDTQLTVELKMMIFNYLGVHSLLVCGQVCKEWRRLTNHPKLWCFQHIKIWGLYQTSILSINEDENTDWKESVKGRYLLDRNWTIGDCHSTKLIGHKGWVTCVDIHHNRLVSSSYDGTVRVWNTQTGNSLKSLPLEYKENLSPIWCVQFKGNTIMAGSSDSLVRQWNMNTGQCVHTYANHEGGVKCLQVFNFLPFFPFYFFFPSFPTFFHFSLI